MPLPVLAKTHARTAAAVNSRRVLGRRGDYVGAEQKSKAVHGGDMPGDALSKKRKRKKAGKARQSKQASDGGVSCVVRVRGVGRRS